MTPVSLTAVMLIVLGALLRYGLQLAAQVSAAHAAMGLARGWRVALYARLFGSTLVGSGATATVLIDHIGAIEARIARFDPLGRAAAATPLAVAALVATASWVTALILLVTLVPFAIGMVLAGTAARQASDRQIEAIAALSELYVDRVRHLPIIRHFAAGERIARQASAAADDVARRTLVVLRAAFLSSAVLEFFAALSVALVAVYCGFSLLGLLPFPAPETLTLRQAFFVLAMAPEFYLPMRRLAAAYHERQLGDAAERAINALPEKPPAPAGGCRTTLRNVVMSWPGLRIGPVSLDIDGPCLIIISGATGSGKTSLLSAIAGQCAPAAGEIETLPADRIAWAAQAPLLLPGTLLENLRLGRPAASLSEIAAIVDTVGLAPLVAARPQGLDTPVDHHAAWLSGGERRRIGLARALIADRPIMLCDEPTADLDAESAASTIRLLRAEARRRAVVVATHDDRFFAIADRLVTL